MTRESLTSEQFDDLTRIAYERWGLELPPGKRALVNNRISKLMRRRGYESVDVLLETAQEKSESLLDLFDVLSTHHTSFFRESGHFDCLIEELEAHSAASAEGHAKKLRFWSAACSNGCEPYTLSIVLHNFLLGKPQTDVRILATDLSESSLAEARRGVYSKKAVLGLPPGCKERHFEAHEEGVSVRPHVRELVTFGAVNLIGPWKMKGPFDAIFCRNVMIYFNAPTRKRLIERLRGLLRPRGLLFVGSAESLVGKDHRLEFVSPGAYRRVEVDAPQEEY